MAHRRCFVQFPHPGREHSPARGAHAIGWNERVRDGKENRHKRKFMRLRGAWADEDGIRKGSGDLWAWGEWEAESDLVRKLDVPEDDSRGPYPRYLWDPYYMIRKDGYGGLHNTDPLIFGDRFLYSNCGQAADSRRGLKCLGRGSVIAFGSGRKIGGEWKWMLDTVLVVNDSIPYDPLDPRRALEGRVPEAFLDVTGGPLADNPEKGPGGCGPGKTELRLYLGATPEDPVEGMFSFFPAKPAGGGSGFPRPLVEELPAEHFTPANTRAPKGAARESDLDTDTLRRLWRSLAAQVRKEGLVLGTRAEPPPPVVRPSEFRVAIARSRQTVVRRSRMPPQNGSR